MRKTPAFPSIVAVTILIVGGLVVSVVGPSAQPLVRAGAPDRTTTAAAVQPGQAAQPAQAAQSGQSAAAANSQIALGPNASLGGRRVLSPDSAWNTPIDHLQVDPQSAKYIASIGADVSLHPDFGAVDPGSPQGAPWGIPYVVVSGDTKRYPVTFEYADESDDVLYPIPPFPPIEGVPTGKFPTGEGDHHILIIDRDNSRLYELFAVRFADRRWMAGAGAVWDLFGDTKRPRGWTSTDAAGLVEKGRIEHALRFTAPKTRRAYTGPANHWASKDTNPNLPPMGLRVRLKASIDVNAFPAHVRPILIAMKTYGMILADNGGPFYLSGAPDPRWHDAEINLLKKIKGSDFEAVQVGTIIAP